VATGRPRRAVNFASSNPHRALVHSATARACSCVCSKRTCAHISALVYNRGSFESASRSRHDTEALSSDANSKGADHEMSRSLPLIIK
jgi:hypothetical protein